MSRSTASAGSRAVVNLRRWLTGAQAYDGDLAGYRVYVVNNYVGHTLCHGHRSCPGTGELSPAMRQQTRGVGACRVNPWPYPEGEEDEG